MAVSAVFKADFTQLTQQVDRAIITLRKFETSTEKVEDSLSRMTDRFSGRKLIEQATLATRAIDEIGGTSKLTQDELQRVGTMAAQAAEKLRLMGQNVPERMQQLATHAKSAGKEIGVLDQLIGKIGPALAATFSIGAITAFAKEIGSFAGKMEDLSAETGISTTKLQALNFAAAGAGLTIEDITNGVSQLSKRLAGGDEGAAQAVDRLGLSMYRLQQQAPDEAFLDISKAIATIENPMERTRTAMELFGGSGGRMLRLMTDDVEGLMAAAQAAGAVIDEALIKKADRFDDAWSQAIIAFKAHMISFVGSIATGVEALNKLRAASAVALPGSATGAGTGLFDLGRAVMNQGQNDIDRKWFVQRAGRSTDRPGVGGALGVPSVPNNLKEIEADLAKAFKESVRGNTEAAAAFDKNADAVKRLSDEYQSFIVKFENAKGEAKFKELAASFSGINDAVNAGTLAIQGFVPNFAKIGSAAATATLDLTKFQNALFGAPGGGMKSQGASQDVGPMGGLFSGLGAMLQKNLGPTILAAFQGGGNVTKSVGGMVGGQLGQNLSESMGGFLTKNLGKTIGGAFGSVIPGLGTLLGGMAGQLLGPLLSKIGSAFKNLFGGPDKQEQEGRAAAAAFRQGMLGELTSGQSAELEQAIAGVWAGNEAGAATLIKVRDAYLAVGRTAEEANAIVDRLFQAEKQGGAAVAQVIKEIEAVIAQGATPAMEAFGDASAEAFAQATAGALALEAAMNKLRYGANNDSSAQGGSVDFDPKMFDAASGSWVTPTFEMWEKLNRGGTEDQFRRAFNLDILNALKNAGIPEDKIREFIASNGGDVSRIGRAFNLPGFARGTSGRYMDFGSGTPAMLHGREKIVTEAEGRADSDLKNELVGLRDDIRRMMQRLPIDFTNAIMTRA